MKNYDWIVVGAGITGAALSYELAKQGFTVLLLEQHASLQGATRFSYGGLAFWAGTTELTRQLCAEGIAIHRSLSQELEGNTQFRELDLVLTIDPTANPQEMTTAYANLAIPPQLVSVETACELEPLLNPAAIAGALVVKHGHIDPVATTQAYTQAFVRLGGVVKIAQVTQLIGIGKARAAEIRITGVTCNMDTYHSSNVAICAGAMSRSLLQAAGIPVNIYFTHAELVEITPVPITLRTLVMPADIRRFHLEAAATQPAMDSLWDHPGHEPAPPILDAGAIQFQDGSLRLGQISRTITDPGAVIDAMKSETAIREQVGNILPALRELPGSWHHCLIAFSRDRLPLIGSIPGIAGCHLFSGFSNPLVIVPALARRFAAQAIGQEDWAIAQLSPDRFS